MHHIRIKLYSLPFLKLNSLDKTCLETSTSDPYCIMYKLHCYGAGYWSPQAFQDCDNTWE